MAQVGAQVDEGLRPWRIACGVAAFAELAAFVATFVLALGFGGEHRDWSYLAAGVLVVLGIAQLLLVREARRRNPSYAPEELYARFPLTPRHRRTVRFSLFGDLLYVPLLALVATRTLELDFFPTVFVLLVASLGGLRTLYRAWRHNSWLAVSGLPEPPRVDSADGQGSAAKS